MNHPNLAWAVIISGCVILIWKFFPRKFVVVHKLDYLKVLSYTTWKEAQEIRVELNRREGANITQVELFLTLAELERDGLVESNTFSDASGPGIEYRKKHTGHKKPYEDPAVPIATCLQPA